jgi:hypothetical protein
MTPIAPEDEEIAAIIRSRRTMDGEPNAGIDVDARRGI